MLFRICQCMGCHFRHSVNVLIEFMYSVTCCRPLQVLSSFMYSVTCCRSLQVLSSLMYSVTCCRPLQVLSSLMYSVTCCRLLQVLSSLMYSVSCCRCLQVLSSLQSVLFPSLPRAPPDVEALRLYLHLPFLSAFETPRLFRQLHDPFAKAVMELEKVPASVLGKYWRESCWSFVICYCSFNI